MATIEELHEGLPDPQLISQDKQLEQLDPDIVKMFTFQTLSFEDEIRYVN